MLSDTQDPQNPQGQDEGFLTSLAAAPFRGVAGAVSGVANLFGANIQDNFGLGHSQGFIPGMVEGVTQFLAGFIPGSWGLGKLGAFSKAGKVASLAKNVAAGAIADFTVFDGNDPRLSNLIQSVPELQNPLTEFLASDKDDGQITGRLKNVIEGAGMGAITDGLIGIFRKLRDFNSKVATGDTAGASKIHEEIQTAAGDIISEPNETQQALDALLDPADAAAARPEEAGRDILKPVAQEPKPVSDAETITYGDVQDRVGYDPKDGLVLVVNTSDTSGFIRGMQQYDSFVREPGSRLSFAQLKGDAKVVSATGDAMKKLAGRKPSGMPQDVWKEKLIDIAHTNGFDAITFARKGNRETVVLNPDSIARRVNVESDTPFFATRAWAHAVQDQHLVIKSQLETVARQADLSPDAVDQMARVIATTKEPEKAVEAVAGIANFEKMGSRGQAAIYKAITDVMDFKSSVPDPQTWDSTVRNATHEVSQMLGMDPHTVALTLDKSSGDVAQAQNRAVGSRLYLNMHLRKIEALARDIVNGVTVTDRHGNALSKDAALEMLGQNIEQFRTIGDAYGRLRGASGRLLNSFKIGVDLMTEHELVRSLEARGGADRVMKMAQRILADSGVGFSHMGKQLMTPSLMRRVTEGAVDWFMFSLLSAPRTLTTNVIGTSLSMFHKPLESALGGWVGKKLLGSARAAEMSRYVRTSLRTVALQKQMLVEAAFARQAMGEETANALGAAGKAWKTGESVLVPDSGPIDKRPQGLTLGNFGAFTGKPLDPAHGLGKAIQTVIDITKLPGRGMQTTDEFAKQVAARAHLKSELIEQASNNGLDGPAADQWVENEMRKMSRDGQLISENLLRREAEAIYTRERFVDPVVRQDHIARYINDHLADNGVSERSLMLKKAVDYAREVTFTKALNPDAKDLGGLPMGGFKSAMVQAGNLLQQFADKHPAVRFFAPFIRTPLNILTYTADRMPIPGMNPDFLPMVQYMVSKTGLPMGLDKAKNRWIQQITHPDPAVAAEAMGRASTAVAAASVFGTAALSGMLTGRGPEDPEQLKVLKATGWQPYSIKVGDIYVSYQRFDPFASMLSFYADWADIARYSPDDAGLEHLATGMFVSTLTNLQSKSYLTGLTDLVGLVSDPVSKFKPTVGKVLGTFLIPNVIAASRDFTDETMPDLVTMADRVRSRIPFLAGGMDKQRNVIGEPLTKRTYGGLLKAAEGIAGYMLPIQVNTTSSDVVSQELSDLAYPFSLPDPIRAGVDLREFKSPSGQSAYDRWQELTSEVTIGGRTLRSSMERLIKSHQYQALQHDGLDKMDLESPRVSLIQSLLGQYRREAERKMMSEFPDLQAQTRDRRAARLALKNGANASGLEALLNR